MDPKSRVERLSSSPDVHSAPRFGRWLNLYASVLPLLSTVDTSVELVRIGNRGPVVKALAAAGSLSADDRSPGRKVQAMAAWGDPLPPDSPRPIACHLARVPRRRRLHCALNLVHN